ncbi:hypothetical protein BU23DRAFT_466056, partial [Bimuria novae-zelandiae CBS 107.79]
GLEIVFSYKRYRKEKLRCFIDTSSRECASYILVHLPYSLWVSEKDWERV